MRTALVSLPLLSFVLVSACGGDSSTDAGLDLGTALDAGTDAPPLDLGPPDLGPPTCGTARPTITSITGTEGLVIARDGTIYYSQSAAVGRLLPDGTNDATWVTLPGGASTVWGIALDATNTHLYVGSPSVNAVYAIDATGATPTFAPLATGAGEPNGVTMGPDGAVYYTDFGAGQVHRVDVATMASITVTTAVIHQANGLMFAPGDANTLYVLSYGDGTLLRLTLDATHHETARMMVAMGLGSPDGITIDATGQFYVTDNAGGRLFRIAADGTGATPIMSGLNAPANPEFGVGALACHDLYIANGGVLARIDTMTGTSGAVVWH